MNQTSNSEAGERLAMNRRIFFKRATGYLSALITLVIGIPLVGSLFSPKTPSKKHFVEVADLDALPTGEPKRVIFSELVKDAFLVEPATSDVWIIKHSESDVNVFSPICPHLGCSYEWQPQTRQFVCPCHTSIFAEDGKVISGPSPRGLDSLPQKIENGKLYLEWERYEVGIPEKKAIY